MTNVFIISAPSGSGKSTLVNEVLKEVSGLEFSVSYTTRPALGIAIAFFAVGWEGVAHVEIGISHTGIAKNLDAVVHPAAPRPAIFDHPDRAIAKL